MSLINIYENYRAQELREADPADIALRTKLPEIEEQPEGHELVTDPEKSSSKKNDDPEKKPEKKKDNYDLPPTSVMARNRGVLRRSAYHTGSTLATAAAHTYEGTAHFFDVMDKAADIVADKTGMAKGGALAKLREGQLSWAAYYRDKITYQDYMTRVVGGILGAGPGITQFSLGPLWAGLEGYTQDGIQGAILGSARRYATGKVFHAISAGKNIYSRMGKGAGFFGSEAVVAGGTLEDIAEQATIGAVFTRKGKDPAPIREMSTRERLEVTSDIFKQLDRGVYEGKIDEPTARVAKYFVEKHPEIDADTSLRVLGDIRMATEEIMRSEGYRPGTAGIVTGSARTTMSPEGILKTAIELYAGADPTTPIEEFFHRQYNHMSVMERTEVERDYQRMEAHQANPRRIEEFYAQQKTDEFFELPQRGPIGKLQDVVGRIFDHVKEMPGNMARKFLPEATAGLSQTPAPKLGFQIRAEKGTYSEKRGDTGPFHRIWTLVDEETGEKTSNLMWTSKEAAEVAARRLSKSGEKSYQIRSVRKTGFTTEAAPIIKNLTTSKKLRSHEKYESAKSGNAEASVTLVTELAKDVSIQEAGERYGPDVIYQPLVAVEASGRNQVPSALAEYYAARTGATAGEEIYQTNVTAHTGEGMMSRLLKRPEFAGGVVRDGKYVLVDDVVTSGGSVAALADYIESKGGKVVGTVFLANAARTGTLSPDAEIVASLRKRFGNDITKELQIEPEALTKQEAAYLNRFPDADALRARATQERGSESQVLLPQDLQERLSHQARPLLPESYRTVDPNQITQARMPEEKYTGNLNLERIQTRDDIKGLLDVVAKHNEEFIKDRRDVITQDQTRELADELGMTVEQVLSRKKGEMWNAEQALAARQMLQASSFRLMNLAKKATGPDASDTDLARYLEFEQVHMAIQAQVAGATAEAGRLLASYRIPAGPAGSKVRAVSEFMQAAGGRERVQERAELLSAMMDASPDGTVSVGQVNQLVRNARKATTPDMLLEVWINALLSGPRTHAKNILSNMLVMGTQVPERWLASQIGRLHGGEKVELGEAGAMTSGMLHGIIDGIKLAGAALRTGESTDPMGKIETPQRAITAENMGITADNWMAKGVDLLGGTVRVPGRMLLVEDEFFKAVGYRMEIHAQAHRLASRIRKEEDLSDNEFYRLYKALVDSPSEDMKMAAADFRQYVTFTNALGETGQKFQGFVNSHPLLKVIFPFVRTPGNIYKYGFARTPLAPLLMKSVREDMAAGGVQRDLAIARMGLGSMMMMATASAVVGGLITGGGPEEPELRSNLRQTGWQPYSIYNPVTKTYTSYQGLEPLGSIVGMAADATEIIMRSESIKDIEDVALVASVAFGRQVTNKTYLMGLSELIHAVDDPVRYGESYFGRLAGTVVPNIANQLSDSLDPYMREASGVMQAVKKRTPWRTELEKMRDRWGEPIVQEGSLGPDFISPLYQSAKKDDYIDEMIAENQIPVPRLRRTVAMAGVPIELDDEQFTQYQIQAGSLARSEMEKLVKRAEFIRATGGPEGGKATAVREVFTRSRAAARQKLTELYPELNALILTKKREIRALRGR